MPIGHGSSANKTLEAPLQKEADAINFQRRPDEFLLGLDDPMGHHN
jgi:hypothetical protein